MCTDRKSEPRRPSTFTIRERIGSNTVDREDTLADIRTLEEDEASAIYPFCWNDKHKKTWCDQNITFFLFAKIIPLISYCERLQSEKIETLIKELKDLLNLYQIKYGFGEIDKSYLKSYVKNATDLADIVKRLAIIILIYSAKFIGEHGNQPNHVRSCEIAKTLINEGKLTLTALKDEKETASEIFNSLTKKLKTIKDGKSNKWLGFETSEMASTLSSFLKSTWERHSDIVFIKSPSSKMESPLSSPPLLSLPSSV